ncbi:MAG: alpha/beta hydrolase [Pseudomonadota bacterium]
MLTASLLVSLPVLSACVHSAIYTSRAEANYPAAGRLIDVNGAKTHVIEQGGMGAPILMIHGASANAQEFTHTLAPLLEDEFRVLMADRPGHGYSKRPKDSDELATQAAQMAGVLDARADGQKAVIVGHSFGGAVALRLALDRPDLVEALVLLAPVTHDWGGGGEAWYNKYAANPVLGGPLTQLIPIIGPGRLSTGINGVFHPEQAPDGYLEAASVPLLFRPKTFRANAKDVTNLRAELAAQQVRYGELSMPVTVYNGHRDTVIKPALHVGKLKQQVPQLDVVDLPQGGHMPHHIHSEAIADTIRSLAMVTAAE